MSLPTETVQPDSAEQPPGFLRRLLRRRLAVACLIYLAVVGCVAIMAPLMLPGTASEQAGDLTAVRQGPSEEHLLGTDSLGRDVLERLLVGTQVTILAVFLAVVVALVLGISLGLLAGYFGRWLDSVIGFLADLTFAMPSIVIILVVLAVFPENMPAAMITFGILASPGMMRIVRSATLSVREELYIAAARVAGLSHRYIIVRHILPRIAGPVIIQASLLAAVALLVQSGLAFLGLVAPEPAPSWGGMVGEGVRSIVLQPWLIWPPGIAITVTILSLGLLADSVRDASTEGWAPPASRRQRQLPVKGTSESAEAIESREGDLLSIIGLRVAFDTPAGVTVVLDDVNLSIRQGETVGLVGESGCGKTATAMSILGLLPGTGRIDAGSIWFDGQDLAALPDDALHRVRGKQIGVISQEPMISLNPSFRIGWQLAEAVRQHHGVSQGEARERAVELLRSVHLPDPEAVARRYPHELSGGMAQRVAIARALAGEPKLLIADEPTTALDVTVQAEIMDLLRQLQEERNMAILLVTHDLGVVADVCDRAYVMYAGEIIERSEIGPMFRRPLHPYTEALLAANPHKAAEAEVLPAIPGTVPKPGQWPTGCRFQARCRYVTDECRDQPIPLERPASDRITRCIHHAQLVPTHEGAASHV